MNDDRLNLPETGMRLPKADSLAFESVLRFVGAEATLVAASDELSAAVRVAFQVEHEHVLLDIADVAGSTDSLFPATTPLVVVLPLLDEDPKPRVPAWERVARHVLGRWGTARPIVLVGPRGLVTDARTADVRCSDLFQITACIEGLPSTPHGIHSSFLFATVVFEPRTHGEQSRPLRVLRSPTAGRPPKGDPPERDMADAIEELFRKQGGVTRLGYIVRPEPDLGRGLSFDRLHPRRTVQQQALRAFGELVKLGELVDFLPAVPVADLRPIGDSDEDHLPAVDGRTIQLPGLINIALARHAGRPGRADPLEPNDILMRALARPEDRSFPVGVVAEDDPLMLLGQNVLALRLKKFDPHVHRGLVAYLRSERFRQELHAEKIGFHITRSVLSEMQVPSLADELIEALRSVGEAEDRMRTWLGDVRDAEEVLFTAESPHLARRDLVRRSLTLRRRIAEAAKLDSFDHLVASQYPYPIAYRWRLLRDATHETDMLNAVLDCFETTCAFTALAGSAVARYEGRPVAHFLGMSQRNSRELRTNFGDWVQILNELGSRRHDDARHGFLVELRDWWADALEFVQPAKDLRDSASHARRPSGQALAELNRARRVDLERLLSAAGFLMDHPVVSIDATRWDSLEGRNSASVRELRGDHPVLPRQSHEFSRPDLEAGSLYLLGASAEPVLLRPLLVGKACPECGTWATFYPDALRAGGCVFKSLEHGHVSEEPCEPALRAVGLWPQEAGG